MTKLLFSWTTVISLIVFLFAINKMLDKILDLKERVEILEEKMEELGWLFEKPQKDSLSRATQRPYTEVKISYREKE